MDCYIRFDQAQGTVLADASFKSADPGHQSVEITGGIQYQGVPMDLLTIVGLTYRVQYPAAFIKDHTFSWTDDQKKPQSFTMHVNPITDFNFGGDSVSHKKPATLRWNGPPLEKGELMMLIWEQEKTHQTVTVELSAVGKGSELEFPAAKMGELSPGKWTVYLIRKKLSKDNVAGMTITCIAELYSKIKTVTVL